LFYNAAMHNREEENKPVAFGTFDAAADVEVTERNLPHWLQPGAAMFITFRTADSLPKDVILRWQRELEEWLAVRGLPVRLAESTVRRRLQNHDALLNQLAAPEAREFKRLADRVFHRSLDECHGACLLKRPVLAKIVGEAILFHDHTKYDLDRFVVMPNHVHAIVQFRSGANLKTVSQSWMRFTAREINAATGGTSAFWQAEPFDHIIRSLEQFEYLQRYIAENPLKANLRPGEFLYWERV
jgi:REP element-mobilizing transposase RayT